MSKPSWKWMSSRPTAPQLAAQAAASKAPSRPCLPAVEPLDQRLMLAANGDIIVEPPNPSGSPAILIGMIKGELNLIKGELAALKLAAADPKLAETPNLIHKLTQSFLKIDDVFYQLSADLIKLDGIKLGDIKGESIIEKKALDEINTQFLKITDLLGEPERGDQLAGVIAILKDNATSLVTDLLKIAPGGELSNKDQQSLLNLASKFESAGDAVLKIQEAALARKAGGKQQEYLEIKLENILVSYAKVELEYKQQVDVEGIIAILIGLLKGTGGSTDGVSIVTTDDVIIG